MNITLLFKSKITTEETYPHSFELKFAREMQINEYKDENELYEIIFKKAHDFESIITNNLRFVGSTTECLGITFIHDAKSSELLDLAKLGLEKI